MILAEKDYSSYGVNTLGLLCLWQFLLNKFFRKAQAHLVSCESFLIESVSYFTQLSFRSQWMRLLSYIIWNGAFSKIFLTLKTLWIWLSNVKWFHCHKKHHQDVMNQRSSIWQRLKDCDIFGGEFWGEIEWSDVVAGA